MLERKPAPERRLAEEEHGAGIAVAGGDLSHRRERGRIRPPFAEIRQRARDQVALVDGVEQFDRARDFEGAPVRSRFRRRPQDEVLVPQPRTRDLAVIGGGIAAGVFVMRARFVASSERFHRASLPIACARERDRIAVAVRDLGEMAERGCGVVEEAQRDPAGGELVLGAVVVLGRHGGVARDPIGGLELVEIKQLACDQPALDPPFVGVDGLAVIVRQGEDQLRPLRPFCRSGGETGRC